MRKCQLRIIVYALFTAATMFNCCTSVAASTHEVSERTKLACVSQMDERTAALTARDWPQLERLAKRYIQSCRDAFDASNVSDAYEDIADAMLGMHHSKEALSAADACISNYYANPSCHVDKVLALLALKRLSAANDAFIIADRLSSHALAQNESDLANATSSSEKASFTARKHKYESQRELLDALRDKYFDK